MGALGRTDFDCGEVEPSDGVGGDGGGYGGLLPVSVGVVDQDPGYSETYTDYQEPQYLAGFRLRERVIEMEDWSPLLWRCERGHGWWRTPGTPSQYPLTPSPR